MWVRVGSLGSHTLQAAGKGYYLGACEVGPAAGVIAVQEAAKAEDDHRGGVRRAESVDLQKMAMDGTTVAQGRYPRP